MAWLKKKEKTFELKEPVLKPGMEIIEENEAPADITELVEEPKIEIIKQEPVQEEKVVEDPKQTYVEVPIVLTEEVARQMIYENNRILKELLKLTQEQEE